MKRVRLSLILMLLFLGLATSPAGAGVKFTGGPIILEVPDGWTAEYVEDGLFFQIRLIAPENRVRLGVIFFPSITGNTKGDAEFMAQNVGMPTTAPEPVPGRESYRFFSRSENQPKIEFIVFTRPPALFAWAQKRRTDDFDEDIKAIWNSLDSSNPHYRALLDELYKQ